MASGMLIVICLLFVIYCHLTLAVDEIPTMASTSTSNNKNIFSRWYKYHRALNNLHSNSIENSPSTNPQRRNVIMPRICYFSRTTKSGIYQKLCLPYNNPDQPWILSTETKKYIWKWFIVVFSCSYTCLLCLRYILDT